MKGESDFPPKPLFWQDVVKIPSGDGINFENTFHSKEKKMDNDKHGTRNYSFIKTSYFKTFFLCKLGQQKPLENWMNICKWKKWPEHVRLECGVKRHL
jgi:hypothetical protein